MSGWVLEFHPRSPLLVASVWDPAAGAHLASVSLSGPDGEPRALLPGSSLRGVLREALARFAEARGGAECAWRPGVPGVCTCPACRLFGIPERQGRLRVSSTDAEARWRTAAHVAIDRETRTAWRAGRALWTERAAVARFEVRVEVLGELAEAEQDLLESFWGWLETVGISVGQRKSAGAGAFGVRVRGVEVSRPEPRLAPSHPGDRRRYALRVRLLEPAHVVGPRQRDFYRDALSVIPGATLRGSLGWALERIGRGDLARELFSAERPVLIGPAFSVEEDWPLGVGVPWLSRRRCRGAGHPVDVLAQDVAAALGGEPTPATCPQCGAPLERGGTPRPRLLVLGHTAIDPQTRRAAQGQLHYQVALEPGTTFEAQLLARPDQAEVLGAVGEVLVGGRRARGMGRAIVEVREIPTPPLEERLKRLADTIQKLGARGADRVAVLGLVSDAAVQPSLAEVVRARGLVPVAGELRTVERGGWDELRASLRPLREVLAAGSWAAVRCPTPDSVAALEELEREGLPDPEEICPLIVVVRGDEGVVRVPEVIGGSSTRGAERDQLVREVRGLCRTHRDRLPERSQLHNLLRYAQQTDSVEEVALFFEYQASRRELQRHASFLKELAERARGRYPGNPEGLREFLAVVVRAAQVEREAARGQRQEGPSGGRGRGA
ncbi:MAG: RAMP superfamily CRISPR-associated protein [Armatimonadota bacterium]|nr:RAMP superfamily CRISPR-associated protein [Armatimonadota bacterium]